MSLTKIKDIKIFTIQEIEKKIIDLKIEILELKIKKATRQSVKNHILKQKKRKIAQLLTVKTQKLKSNKT